MEAPQRNLVMTLKYYLGMYRLFLTNYGRKLVEYRSDTMVSILGGILMQGGFVIFLQVIYQKIPKLHGFSADELFFLFGFVTIGREVNRMFFDSPFRVGNLIRRGQLDIFLIRPCSALFQVIAVDIQANAIGGVAVGLVVMCTAIGHLHLVITVWSIGWLIVAVLCNILIQYGVLMSVASLSFRLSEVNSILLPISWLYEFNRYPITVFPGVLQGLLTFVLPFALASFYPASFFLRPAEFPWVPVVVPIVAVGLCWLANRLWNRGLSRYTSANA